MKEMRLLLAVLVVGGLAACISACGVSNKAPSAASQTTPSDATNAASTAPTDTQPAPLETKVDADNDNDVGAVDDDKNNKRSFDFGHAADAADTRAITALIKRYYVAAVSENGAAACRMTYSTLEESVPEDYGQSPPGQPFMRGSTCAAVLTLLFKHYHPQLALETPKLTVARVRLVEHHGIVILNFGALPARQISVAREGHIWKLETLLDSEVP